MTRSEMYSAIASMVSSGLGFEALYLLTQALRKQNDSILLELADKRATLRAVRKLNSGKNEAIDALTEEMEENKNERIV